MKELKNKEEDRKLFSIVDRCQIITISKKNTEKNNAIKKKRWSKYLNMFCNKFALKICFVSEMQKTIMKNNCCKCIAQKPQTNLNEINKFPSNWTQFIWPRTEDTSLGTLNTYLQFFISVVWNGTYLLKNTKRPRKKLKIIFVSHLLSWRPVKVFIAFISEHFFEGFDFFILQWTRCVSQWRYVR